MELCHSGCPDKRSGPTQERPMNLDEMIEAARRAVMTPTEEEQQRRSFAFGNANIENSRVTRETVDAAARKLEHERK